MEYINKKWDLPTMEKKIDNLKKIIQPSTVDIYVSRYIDIADTRLDALYLAYYAMKDDFCKVKRRLFGKPKSVEFKYKANPATQWYYSNYGLYGTTANISDSYWDYAAYTSAVTSNTTWTVTTATNTYWNSL